ncbi:MAG: hypothetical protein ACE5HN_10670 [Nitrospiria bacterium]
MGTIVVDPNKEAAMLSKMNRVRPYLDEVLGGIVWSDLKDHLREVRAERRFKRGCQ